MNTYTLHDLTAVVAMDADRGIGKNNALAWHLPEDLAHFKRVTVDKPIIMGRKTFESIGKPLPMRENIVLSQSADCRHQGVKCVHTIEQALDVVGSQPATVIGGSEIYRLMMPYVRRLIITEIDAKFDCDKFFPEINKYDWREVERSPSFLSEKAQLRYGIVTYTRNA